MVVIAIDAETASKDNGAFTRSVKFLSPEFVLYLHKSTLRPYRILLPCLGWCSKLPDRYTGPLVRYFLLLLNPLLIVKIEPFFSYIYHFGRCTSELADLVSFCYPCGRLSRCSNRLHNFFVSLNNQFFFIQVILIFFVFLQLHVL